MTFKVLFSNLGYARGIDGTLAQHLRRWHRHIYTGVSQQQETLAQFKEIIATEQPDICCLVEVDSGSWNAGHFNQVNYLLDDDYTVHDIAGKYGEDSLLAQMPFFAGKCNAFLSRLDLPRRKLYFKNGSKRLIYAVDLPGGAQLFFAHFSLQATVRARQFNEIRALIGDCGKEAVILADFNILRGFSELAPLLLGTDLCVLNDESEHTFMFGNRRLTLDLCIASATLAPKMRLRVIPQPFSDHAALLLEMGS